MINVHALHKSYGGNKVLKGVDMHFAPGSVTGVVGENGAGKSTLFRCIAQMEAFQGQVEYEGGVLKDVTGFLETNPYFLSKITGLEHLHLLCRARKRSPRKIKEKNIFDLPLDRYAASYSTGMKKKLAFLGLLLQQNEVFILDEPFNGVDIHSNLMLKEIILQLKAKGKTVILSSHLFSALHDSCDRLYLLQDGLVAAEAGQGDFGAIEAKMRKEGIGKRIEALGL